MDVLNDVDWVDQVVTGRGPVVDVFIYLSSFLCPSFGQRAALSNSEA